MVGDVLVGAGDGFAAVEVFGFNVDAVGGEDEFDFGFGVGGAGFEGGECCRDLARVAGEDVDVVCLEYAAEVGFVGCARTQAFDGGGFVAEGFEEGVGEGCRVKGVFCKVGDGLFDLNGVHGGVVVCCLL